MDDWGLIRIASHKNWSKNERKKRQKFARPDDKKQKLRSAAQSPQKITHYAMAF